jgi:hypothetical protein
VSGARYQEARTLVLAGGDGAERGESTIDSLGATPMPRPEPPAQSRP